MHLSVSYPQDTFLIPMINFYLPTVKIGLYQNIYIGCAISRKDICWFPEIQVFGIGRKPVELWSNNNQPQPSGCAAAGASGA